MASVHRLPVAPVLLTLELHVIPYTPQVTMYRCCSEPRGSFSLQSAPLVPPVSRNPPSARRVPKRVRATLDRGDRVRVNLISEILTPNLQRPMAIPALQRQPRTECPLRGNQLTIRWTRKAVWIVVGQLRPV